LTNSLLSKIVKIFGLELEEDISWRN